MWTVGQGQCVTAIIVPIVRTARARTPLRNGTPIGEPIRKLMSLRTPVSRTGRIHFRVNTRPVRMCFKSERRPARDSFQRLGH